jgi:RNA polymerase sigma factor (sigma-70 family)
MEKCLHIDLATWNAFRNGDKQAYSIIFRRYYIRLFEYGRRFTKKDTLIEDCILEVLTSFWLQRQKLQAVESMESYLFVSFRNKLMKTLSTTDFKTRVPATDEYVFEFELSIDQVMINAERLYEQRINLGSALETLTARQKEAIYFKYYENLSYRQIADILSITTKATYKLVARAISELRLVYQQKMATFFLSFAVLIF